MKSVIECDWDANSGPWSPLSTTRLFIIPEICLYVGWFWVVWERRELSLTLGVHSLKKKKKKSLGGSTHSECSKFALRCLQTKLMFQLACCQERRDSSMWATCWKIRITHLPWLLLIVSAKGQLLRPPDVLVLSQVSCLYLLYSCFNIFFKIIYLFF